MRFAPLLLLPLLLSASTATTAEPVTNSLGMKFVEIPAGEFMMGTPESVAELAKLYPGYLMVEKEFLYVDERPPHRVRITKPFRLAIHETTREQFEAFVNDSGYKTEAEADGTGGWGYNAETGHFEGRKTKYSWRDPGYPQEKNHPVVDVTFADVNAFCDWLSKKEGKKYRLPTEAEWEYACRAGTKTRYSFGDDPKMLAEYANTGDASGTKTLSTEFPLWKDLSIPTSDSYVFTAPVGSFKPNPWGLYDMHGNVWEWCSDRFGDDYYQHSPVDDPKGPDEGNRRARRGGAWHTFPLFVRSSFRNYNTPVSRYLNLGFRVAMSE